MQHSFVKSALRAEQNVTKRQTEALAYLDHAVKTASKDAASGAWARAIRPRFENVIKRANNPFEVVDEFATVNKVILDNLPPNFNLPNPFAATIDFQDVFAEVEPGKFVVDTQALLLALRHAGR